MKLQATARGSQVDPVSQADKSDAEISELFEQQHKVPEIPAEPI